MLALAETLRADFGVTADSIVGVLIGPSEPSGSEAGGSAPPAGTQIGYDGVGSVFIGSTRAPLSLGGGGEGFVLHVYVDACLIEVIANNRTLLSSQVLTPDASYDGVAVFGDVPPQAVDVWKLASIWR